MIRRQTEQLTRIVNDLLDISRLTAGKLILHETALDLAALVDRCVKELGGAHALDHHRRELRLARAPVRGDSVRLEQVVTNLLTNAVKYTPASGTITVEVEPVGDEAVLRVRDTGIGIAPDLLPRIFDLFVQSERGLDRRDGGLGVGLSIVRRLVEAHGGRVEARSAGTDRGAEIIVRLPLADAPAERRERLAQETPAPSAGASWSSTTTWTRAKPWSRCSSSPVTTCTRPRTARAASSRWRAFDPTPCSSTSVFRASTASSSPDGCAPEARACASSR